MREPMAQQRTELTVVTYNVRSAIGPGPFPDQWWRAVDAERVARLISILHGFDADLVALQEVPLLNVDGHTLDMAREFGDGLGMEVRYAAVFAFPVVAADEASSIGAGLFGNAVLSRLPVISSRTLGLPAGPDSEVIEPLGSDRRFAGVRYADTPTWTREPRCASVCDVRLPDGGPLTFVSVHLSHIGGGQRRRQADKLAELATAADRPLVLAGDLNATIEADDLAPLSGLLEDAFAMVGIPAGDERRRSCGDDWHSAIDHVLLRGATTLKCQVARDAGDASDHWPVVARIALDR